MHEQREKIIAWGKSHPYVVGGIAVLLLIPLLLLLFSTGGQPQRPGNNPEPTITPYPRLTGLPSGDTQISPLKRVSAGQTLTETAARSLPGYTGKKVIDDNHTIFSLKSQFVARTNEIRTTKNSVVFEREIAPDNPKDPAYAKVSDYKKKYGEPEKIIKGSKFYGEIMSTYIYARLGFAFIGNSYTDEIQEFHFFTPTTLYDYITNYGEDIDSSTNSEQVGE